MQQQIIIHIGDFKTGSTSIQNALETALCTPHGKRLFVPEIGDPRNLAKTLGDPAHTRFLRRRFRRLNRQLNRATWDAAVVSSEQFMSYPAQKLFDAINKYLPRHRTKIRIIAYVRPHIGRVTAEYGEQIKQGFLTGPMEEMYAWQMKRKILFYHKCFTDWRRLFGDAFTLRPFIEQEMQQGDAVYDFFFTVFGGAHFDLKPPPRRNPSLSLQDLSILRFLHLRAKESDVNLMRMQAAFGWNFAAILASHPAPTATRLKTHSSLCNTISQALMDDAKSLDRAFFHKPLFENAMNAGLKNAVELPQSMALETHFSPDMQRFISCWGDLVLRQMQSGGQPFLSSILPP